MGRAIKFDKLNILKRLDEIEVLFREGATNKEFCERFNISKTIFNNWIRYGSDTSHKDHFKYKKFKDAVERGRYSAIPTLKKRAYDVAIGYTEEEECLFVIDGEIVREMKTVIRPPKEGMLRFLLVNWLPDEFKDSKTIDHSGKLDVLSSKFINISDEELFKIQDVLLNNLKLGISNKTGVDVSEVEIKEDLDDI